MWIGDELWSHNNKASYEKYGAPYEIPSFAQDEDNESGYLDFFDDMEKKIDLKHIDHLKIEYIDRGINSFLTFGNMLHSTFPNLKTLDFAQNYTYHQLYSNATNILHIEYLDFLNTLKMLKLKNFRLNDSQSSFFSLLKIDDIFENMPDDSLFVLRQSTGQNIEYEKRGTKEVYLYF
jgi:hypothetical protein